MKPYKWIYIAYILYLTPIFEQTPGWQSCRFWQSSTWYFWGCQSFPAPWHPLANFHQSSPFPSWSLSKPDPLWLRHPDLQGSEEWGQLRYSPFHRQFCWLPYVLYPLPHSHCQTLLAPGGRRSYQTTLHLPRPSWQAPLYYFQRYQLRLASCGICRLQAWPCSQRRCSIPLVLPFLLHWHFLRPPSRPRFYWCPNHVAPPLEIQHLYDLPL